MGNANIKPAFKDFIGRGSFGIVYRGTYDKQPVAVKVINTHMLPDEFKNIDKNELIPFVKGLKHPNIVTIFAWEDRGHEIWLALELCDAGLDKYMKDHDPSTDETWDIIWQCANGLCHLHTNNVVHRDVKPDNFLVVMKNGRAVMKVTDFSLCKDVGNELGSTMSTVRVRGNKNWLAPELLTKAGKRATNVRYKRSVDVFSFALVIIYVLVNKTGREKLSRACCGAKVKLGEDVLSLFHELWRNTELKDTYMPLLRRMLEVDPQVRCAMEDVRCFRDPPIASVPPRIVSTAPRLVLQTSHRLGYEALPRVGIGGRHLILLTCEKPRPLRLLQLQGDVGYKELWEKDFPQGVHSVCSKHVACDDSLFTHGGYRSSDPTRCWSREFAPLHTHMVSGVLELRAVLPDHRLAYSEAYYGIQLALFEGDRRVCTLRPPAGTRWGEFAGLSICQHPVSGWMAVAAVDDDIRTLTIFDGYGELQHHVQLQYVPGSWDAITCTAAHLVVSEEASTVLHFHAWDGKEVGRVDLRRVAELGWWDKRVWNVSVCEGDVLHVAVGRPGLLDFFFGNVLNGYVTSLHAFKIK